MEVPPIRKWRKGLVPTSNANALFDVYFAERTQKAMKLDQGSEDLTVNNSSEVLKRYAKLLPDWFAEGEPGYDHFRQQVLGSGKSLDVDCLKQLASVYVICRVNAEHLTLRREISCSYQSMKRLQEETAKLFIDCFKKMEARSDDVIPANIDLQTGIGFKIDELWPSQPSPSSTSSS